MENPYSLVLGKMPSNYINGRFKEKYFVFAKR